MAVQLNVRTEVETRNAEKSVNSLRDKMGQLIDVQKEQLDSAKRAAKETKEGLQGATGATSGLAKGFRGVGLAIKAAGIGLVIGVLSQLKQLFEQNQQVTDAYNTAFSTLAITFNQVFTAITNSITAVSEVTNGFESLAKVLGGIITLQLTPIKTLFFGIKLAVQEAQLAWEQSFFGDDDPKEVERLNKAITQTKNDIVDVGKDALNAGKDIFNNFSGAVNEIVQLGNTASDELSKVNIKAANEQAKALTEIRNQAVIAEAVQEGVIQKAERAAEKLRQQRDTQSASDEDRLEASEKLEKQLEKQADEERKLVNIKINAAQQALALDENNVQAQAALIQAKNRLAELENRIETQRTEQQRAQESLEQEIADNREKRLKDYEQVLKDVAETESQAAENTAEKQKAKEKEVLETQEAAAKAKIDIARNVFTIGQQLAEEGSIAAKGVAAAQALFDAYLAINKTLATVPPPFNIPLAATIGASALLNVRKILQTDPKGGGAGVGGSTSINAPRGGQAEQDQFNTPDFGFVNQGVGGQQNANFQTPRAYVVSQDIEDQRQLDNRIKDLAKTS